MSKWTKEYRKEYDRKYNAANYEARHAKQKERIREIRDWFSKYKASLVCAKCPENHPACLHFHHLRDKDFEVSVMVCQGSSKEKILSEIDKCIVLCANCHAKQHYVEGS